MLLLLLLLQLEPALWQPWQGEWQRRLQLLLLLSDYVIAVVVVVCFSFVCAEKRFVFVLNQLSLLLPRPLRRLCVLSECCASREFVAISHCQRTRSPVNFD